MATPLRILRVIYDLQVGGVQRQLLRVLPRLRGLGIEPHVCCLRGEGELAGEFRAAEIPLHFVPFKSRLDPIGLLRLRTLIRRERFDVVHAHMYASNVAVNAALVMMQGPIIVNGYHSQRPFQDAHQAKMARRLIGAPACLVAVSKAVEAPLLEAGLPGAKIRVLHNGVEVPKEALPLPAGDKGTPIRLLWAGRFVKQKRPGMAIDIAVALREAGVPFHLTLAGDGPLLSQVQGRAAAAGLGGDISFAGWQSDMSRCLAEADVYLSTSNREGLANALLEALSAARPCLVSDIPPNREVLDESGAGHCIDDDPQHWRAHIRRLQADRGALARMSHAAYTRAQAFSIDATAEGTAALYRELLENR